MSVAITATVAATLGPVTLAATGVVDRVVRLRPLTLPIAAATSKPLKVMVELTEEQFAQYEQLLALAGWLSEEAKIDWATVRPGEVNQRLRESIARTKAATAAFHGVIGMLEAARAKQARRAGGETRGQQQRERDPGRDDRVRARHAELVAAGTLSRSIISMLANEFGLSRTAIGTILKKK